MQLKPTGSTWTPQTSPAKGQRSWAEVPMSDVYKADVDRGAQEVCQPGRGIIATLLGGAGVKRTRIHWETSSRGISDSATAWQATQTLKSENRKSHLYMALGAGLAMAGMGVLGWQVNGLVEHLMTPGSASLLSTTLGTALQTAALATGGVAALAGGKGMYADNQWHSLEVENLSQEVQELATLAANSPGQPSPIASLPQPPSSPLGPPQTGAYHLSPILSSIYQKSS